jgi:hypothetical protein
VEFKSFDDTRPIRIHLRLRKFFSSFGHQRAFGCGGFLFTKLSILSELLCYFHAGQDLVTTHSILGIWGKGLRGLFSVAVERVDGSCGGWAAKKGGEEWEEGG